MSIKAIQWAFGHDHLFYTKKLVLVALAYHADNETGECFPAKAMLIRETGLSKVTIQTALRELREGGLITDTEKRRGRTGQVVVYRVNFHKGSCAHPLERQNRSTPDPFKGSGDDPLKEAKGSNGDMKGVKSQHERGQMATPLYRRTVREPSGNRQRGARAKKPSVPSDAKSAKRGTRLPGGWEPRAPDWETAVSALGDLEAARQLDTFRDHWASQPGQRGVKLDWDATWRNWVRRAPDFRGNGARASPPDDAAAAQRERELTLALVRDMENGDGKRDLPTGD